MSEADSPAIRILLVDDEEDLVSFLAHRLLKRGFTVTATTSGEAALEAARRQTIDVAVVDLKMPDMDGITVLRRMRDIQPYLKTIMLTGHGSHESALEAGRLDTVRYAIKPCEFDELLAMIQDAYRCKREEQRAAFTEEMRRESIGVLSPRELKSISDRLRLKYEQD